MGLGSLGSGFTSGRYLIQSKGGFRRSNFRQLAEGYMSNPISISPSSSPSLFAATSPGRRRNMQANRRRDTRPELALRSILHSSGYRYRVDLRLDIAGKKVRPDIVFTRQRLAIFVDGCFWHSCPEHGHSPVTNESYWSPKLLGNHLRDQRNSALLESSGWLVMRIWEHEPAEEAAVRICAALLGRQQFQQQ